MRLPLSTASKLLSMMENKMGFPASSMAGEVVQKMIENGVLQKIQSGRTKAMLLIKDADAVKAFIYNQFGIPDLGEYIKKLSAPDLLRSEAVMASGNSKLRSVRTFKGFLVNCYKPVMATLHGEPFLVQPSPGSFTFIYDYESFQPDPAVTIVYIENPENFRYIELQRHLFGERPTLFVCRYPHSHDLIKWLRDIISNRFVYFGDLDFAGINIYLNEYRKHLGSRASFLVPENVEYLIGKYGNRELYNRQLNYAPGTEGIEASIIALLELFIKYKRVVEQEIFIRPLQS